MLETIKIHISEFNDFYTSIFKIKQTIDETGVCVLRGIDFSAEQQFEAMIALGDTFGWYPNSKVKTKNYYLENHEFTIKNRIDELTIDVTDEKYRDRILVGWHMEHIGFINPAVGASWNMKTFTCNEECGKTYFVDAHSVFCQLNEEDIDFLEKCQYALRSPDVKNESQYTEMGVLPNGSLYLNPIVNHKTLNLIKMVRIFPTNDANKHLELISLDSKKPNQSESANFNRICDTISNIIFLDTGIRITHKWRQHDFLICDLSRMYHAVTGGFRSDQRYFEGMWAYGNPGSKTRIEELE